VNSGLFGKVYKPKVYQNLQRLWKVFKISPDLLKIWLSLAKISSIKAYKGEWSMVWWRKRKMTTPNKQEIVQKAVELWRQDRIRANDPSFDINPEIEELREGGYLSSAQSELMRDSASHEVSEWKGYIQQIENVENFEKNSETDKEDFFDVETALRSGFCIFGNSGSGKTNLGKIVTDKLREHGVTVYVLDVSNQWHDMGFPIVHVSRAKTDYQFNGDTVFDLSDLPIWDKVSFSDLLCETLLSQHDRSQWEMLIFEECQTFIPNNALRNLKKYANILSFLTIGRNYKLRYGMISQFPSYVEKFFVRNTQLRYWGFMYEPNDYRYARQILGKENTEQLKTLKVGEFLYQNNDKIRKVKVPLRKPIRQNGEPCFTFELKVSA
jgi:hypothetical protein